MLRQKNDLPHMIGVVRQLPIDGLQDGVWLAPDRHRAIEVFRLQSLDGLENNRPAFLPPARDFGAGGSDGIQFELLITIAGWLFTVCSQEIGEARAHVATQVLDDDRDGIRLGVESDKHFFIRELRHGSISQALVAAKLALDFVDIVGSKIDRGHAEIPRAPRG